MGRQMNPHGMITTVPVSKTVLVWTLLIAALLAPIADVAAFGIHDHISVSDVNSGDLTTDGSERGSRHHCELGMSPGTLLGPVQAPLPFDQVTALELVPAPSRGSQTPSVPFSPPRS